MTKIGVFYDGNYFLHVSNYYNYSNSRRARIDLQGLHRYIKTAVAQAKNESPQNCHIVDAHYFRGRLNARDASQKGNQLYYDRVFDDILMNVGITAHYSPLRGGNQLKTEKGLDVRLALEALEQSFYRKFDVLVLIASDGDYVPLIRKLNGLGTEVMLMSWDFSYINSQGEEVVTRTSQKLMEEVSYPMDMHALIEKGLQQKDSLVEELFSTHESNFKPQEVKEDTLEISEEMEQQNAVVSENTESSEIITLKEGFGFIKFPNNNLFFYHTDLVDVDFNELRVGDPVSFDISQNNKGQHVAKNVKVLLDLEEVYEE